MIFKRGDFITATYDDGRTVEAVVILASANGRSLAISWGDGMLGGHVGMMPILQEADGNYYSLIEHRQVILELKRAS